MALDSQPIVVVDDDHDIRDLIAAILEDRGFDPICLPDALDIVQIASERRPTVFLLDLMLRETTGIEVARRLRADGAPDTPILAMSASGRMLREASDTHLFTEVVAKPFNVDDLIASVERSLRNTRD